MRWVLSDSRYFVLRFALFFTSWARRVPSHNCVSSQSRISTSPCKDRMLPSSNSTAFLRPLFSSTRVASLALSVYCTTSPRSAKIAVTFSANLWAPYEEGKGNIQVRICIQRTKEKTWDNTAYLGEPVSQLFNHVGRDLIQAHVRNLRRNLLLGDTRGRYLSNEWFSLEKDAHPLSTVSSRQEGICTNHRNVGLV